MTTKPPGIFVKMVNGVEIRRDGSWFMCITYRGKTRRLVVEEQFKSRAEAYEWAEKNGSEGDK